MVQNTVTLKLQTTIKEMMRAKNPLLSFVRLVLDRTQKLTKADTKDGIEPAMNDDYTIKAIRAEIKQNNDTIKIIEEKNADDPHIGSLKEKNNLLLSLLPAQATEEEIEAAVVDFMDGKEFSNPKQAIGPAMKYLADKFGTSLDKALASKVIQKIVG